MLYDVYKTLYLDTICTSLTTKLIEANNINIYLHKKYHDTINKNIILYIRPPNNTLI